MKQITEDYVSFETAVLLKDKGFDIPCWNYYYNSKLEHYFRPVKNNEWPLDIVSAPTLQMTLKWLREVHKIHINLDIHWLHFVSQNGCLYVIELLLVNGIDYIDSKGDENDAIFFSTDEQAVEAALKYILKNLI